MTQGEALKAYMALRELNKEKLSGKLALKIFDLFTKLKPIWDFQVQEEQKISENHPKFDMQTMGMEYPDDEEERVKVAEEMRAIEQEFKSLSSLTVDVDFEPFDFSLSQENIKISAETIGNLKSFINFVD